MIGEEASVVNSSALQADDRKINIGAPSQIYLLRIRIVEACTEPDKGVRLVFVGRQTLLRIVDRGDMSFQERRGKDLKSWDGTFAVNSTSIACRGTVTFKILGF